MEQKNKEEIRNKKKCVLAKPKRYIYQSRFAKHRIYSLFFFIYYFKKGTFIYEKFN